MSVGCVIPAAGRGERMGGGTPKALRGLGGSTLLEVAVRSVAECHEVDHFVVAAPPEMVASAAAMLDSLELRPPIRVVAGGASRTESVRNGVAALPDDVSVILVHDAARPLVPPDMVMRVIASVRGGAPAVVPVVPVVDTIKEVDGHGAVCRTVDRSRLRAAQTPQGFAADVLRRVLGGARGGTTDDVGLAELAGVPVTTVPGDDEALKITRPLDLWVAEAILTRRSNRVH